MKTINLGIDIGFGEVKVIGDLLNGRPKRLTENFKFPTALQRLQRERIKGLDTKKTPYNFNDQQFFLGKDAQKSITIRDVSFLVQYAPLFIFKVVKEFQKKFEISDAIFNDAEKNMCLGLPLENYFNFKDELALKTKEINVNNKAIKFNNVNVCPQGQGVLFDFFVNENGDIDEQWNSKNIIIIDIGFNTVDVLVIENGLISSSDSLMIPEFGVCRITEQLHIFLKEEYDTPSLSEKELKDILKTQSFSVYNKPVNIKKELIKIQQQYAEDLFFEIKNRLNSFLMKSNRLILAGGGAYYVQDYFTKKFSENSSFLYYPEKPEFANARGYLKFINFSI